jgi:hypothetical protein
MAPFAALSALWLSVVFWVRVTHRSVPGSGASGRRPASSPPGSTARRACRAEHPAGIAAALSDPPALLPLLALAATAGAAAAGRGAGLARRGRTRRQDHLGFAALWAAAFALPVAPLVRAWSGYYYALAAVGGALAVGWFCRRIDRWGWALLVTGTLWWHAAGSGTRAFAVTEDAWGWTSHLTTFYFQRGAALTDTLRRALRRIEPSPPHGTRFFMATLPPWAGFQSGNGPLIRDLYRDTSLASYFYSQFGYATAGDRPCRFLYWDGVPFEPIYSAASEPWFQVGSDLLLLERPAGAAHAFRSGLAAGEMRQDHLYWLGWAGVARAAR